MKIQCPNCQFEGKAKIRQRGSCLLLVFLFLFFIIPGIFYLLWMGTGRNVTCPKCGYKYVIKK